MNMKKLSLFLLFLLVCFTSVSSGEETGQGRVTGKMMIKDGGPMSGGAVFIYDAIKPMPMPDKYFRVPDDVALINDDGSFSVEIDPGTYYVGGILKISWKGPGPPKVGDYFFISQEAAGMPKAYVVNENETLDIGIISEAVPYKEITVTKGVTAIEGAILNKKGVPVEGVVVFAEITTSADQSISFVSGWTGEDGKYFLRVYDGGTYNLNAANSLDSQEVYRLESTGPVSVNSGEVLMGINMRSAE